MKCALHWFHFYLQLHKEALLNFSDTRYGERKYFKVDHQQREPPIIIYPDLERWYFNSYSRGYHVYMNIWIPLIGDETLICWKEKGNEYDPHDVAITRNNVDVERAFHNICDHFWKFLSLLKTSIRTRVLDKRVNAGAGYGLESPVCFIFQGHVKGIAWVKKKIKDTEKMIQSRIEKCMKNAL